MFLLLGNVYRPSFDQRITRARVFIGKVTNDLKHRLVYPFS